MERLIETLKPGSKLSEVYERVVKEVDAKFADKFPASLGDGIGQACKEDGLNITAQNDTVV